MSTITAIGDVRPEQALRDARVVSRAIYSDPLAMDGKYFLILKEGQYFIFVVAFQHVNKTINPTGLSWSGGTQIEIPALAFRWLLSWIDEHHAQTTDSLAGVAHTLGSVKDCTKSTILGEQLMLSRMSDNSGFVLENHSRCVHLPWANANWHQKLVLTDQVLFEQGYWAVLNKLAARLPPVKLNVTNKQREIAEN